MEHAIKTARGSVGLMALNNVMWSIGQTGGDICVDGTFQNIIFKMSSWVNEMIQFMFANQSNLKLIGTVENTNYKNKIQYSKAYFNK